MAVKGKIGEKPEPKKKGWEKLEVGLREWDKANSTLLKIEIEFQEEVLATSPGNTEIFKDFIGSKSPDAQTLQEEIAALGTEEVERKQKTIFPVDDGKPFVYDYQIKGMFKDYCSMLRRYPGYSISSKLEVWQKQIDGGIFPHPRKIFLMIPEGMKIGDCQRPLRSMTRQGERVSLANSETVPAGTKIQFEVELLDPRLEAFVIEWLDYGALRGFGQWRNSGKGLFSWKRIE